MVYKIEDAKDKNAETETSLEKVEKKMEQMEGLMKKCLVIHQ